MARAYLHSSAEYSGCHGAPQSLQKSNMGSLIFVEPNPGVERCTRREVGFGGLSRARSESPCEEVVQMLHESQEWTHSIVHGKREAAQDTYASTVRRRTPIQEE